MKILLQSSADGSLTVLLHRLSVAALDALTALAALPLSPTSPRHGHSRVYSPRPETVRQHLQQAWQDTEKTVESLSLQKAPLFGQIAPRRKARTTARAGSAANPVNPVRAEPVETLGQARGERDSSPLSAPPPSLLTTPEVPMPTQLEYVEAQVMQLSPAERNHLLERLIISLEADPEVEAAWEQLTDQREAELESGLAQEIPFEEAMLQLRAKLA